MSRSSSPTYDEVFAAVLDPLDDPLVVPNLGSNTSALMSYGPRDADLYLWGGMGLTHSIALGLAVTCPDRQVVALDGDGSLVMGMAGMATIGALAPSNLLHVVLDNASWGNTGGQPTHTAWNTSLAQVARGCGYPNVSEPSTADELRAQVTTFAADPELTMVVYRIPFEPIGPAPTPPEPVLITRRFMRATGAVVTTEGV
jgi:thiamine pyrophosphate-dependent acetolactate synthase large subunit-like protein